MKDQKGALLNYFKATKGPTQMDQSLPAVKPLIPHKENQATIGDSLLARIVRGGESPSWGATPSSIDRGGPSQGGGGAHCSGNGVTQGGGQGREEGPAASLDFSTRVQNRLLMQGAAQRPVIVIASQDDKYDNNNHDDEENDEVVIIDAKPPPSVKSAEEVDRQNRQKQQQQDLGTAPEQSSQVIRVQEGGREPNPSRDLEDTPASLQGVTGVDVSLPGGPAVSPSKRPLTVDISDNYHHHHHHHHLHPRGGRGDMDIRDHHGSADSPAKRQHQGASYQQQIGHDDGGSTMSYQAATSPRLTSGVRGIAERRPLTGARSNPTTLCGGYPIINDSPIITVTQVIPGNPLVTPLKAAHPVVIDLTT